MTTTTSRLSFLKTLAAALVGAPIVARAAATSAPAQSARQSSQVFLVSQVYRSDIVDIHGESGHLSLVPICAFTTREAAMAAADRWSSNNRDPQIVGWHCEGTISIYD